MGEDEILLIAAARAMGRGIAPARIDAWVRQKTGISLQELGARFGQQPQEEPLRQQLARRGVPLPPGFLQDADEIQETGDVGALAARGASLGLSALIPGEKESVAGARDRLPRGAELLAEAAGGFAVPSGSALRFVKGAASTGGRMLRGALAAGGGGGVYGASTGEGDWRDRLESGVETGIPSAAIGALAPALSPILLALGRGTVRSQGLVGSVAREVAGELRTPLGRAKAEVRRKAKELGTQLEPEEVNRLAEHLLAEKEGRLTAGLRREAVETVDGPPVLPDPNPQPPSRSGIIADETTPLIEPSAGPNTSWKAMDIRQARERSPAELGMTPRATASPTTPRGAPASAGGTPADRRRANTLRAQLRVESNRRSVRRPLNETEIPDLPSDLTESPIGQALAKPAKSTPKVQGITDETRRLLKDASHDELLAVAMDETLEEPLRGAVQAEIAKRMKPSPETLARKQRGASTATLAHRQKELERIKQERLKRERGGN